MTNLTTNIYLFQTTIIGAGTEISPFISSISSYSTNFRSNDGRTDITVPDEDHFAMLVEAELNSQNLTLAQNDPRMHQLVPEQMPNYNDKLYTFMTQGWLNLIKKQMERDKFDSTLLNLDMTFKDYYKIFLYLMMFRQILKEDYFKYGMNETIEIDILEKIIYRFMVIGFINNFPAHTTTPRQIITMVLLQLKSNKKLQRSLQTHLDLPIHADTNVIGRHKAKVNG